LNIKASETASLAASWEASRERRVSIIIVPSAAMLTISMEDTVDPVKDTVDPVAGEEAMD